MPVKNEDSSHVAPTPDLVAFVQDLPKAELHIHLEGAIRPATVLELARRHDRLSSLPATTPAGLHEWFVFTDFPHFVRVYMTIQDLLRTPEDFELIAYECGRDMAAQNIRYRELTITPFTHTDLQAKGLDIHALLDGLTRGRVRAREEFGVEMRWVFDVPRNASFPPGYRSHNGEGYEPEPAARTLEYALLGMEQGVIGFGLGGFEVGAPPAPFAHAFDAAKAAGLLSVPHAGETMGPESVRGALDALGADRIGHGVRAVEDPDLLADLKHRQIPLELNPTSNVCLGVYRRAAEHPFPHLDRMGLLVTVNSDDPPLFNTTLTAEYLLLAREFGYDKANLTRIAANAFKAAGAEPALKRKLLQDLEQWAENALDGGVDESEAGHGQ